jgi:hypothetical protein
VSRVARESRHKPNGSSIVWPSAAARGGRVPVTTRPDPRPLRGPNGGPGPERRPPCPDRGVGPTARSAIHPLSAPLNPILRPGEDPPGRNPTTTQRPCLRPAAREARTTPCQAGFIQGRRSTGGVGHIPDRPARRWLRVLGGRHRGDADHCWSSSPSGYSDQVGSSSLTVSMPASIGCWHRAAVDRGSETSAPVTTGTDRAGRHQAVSCRQPFLCPIHP